MLNKQIKPRSDNVEKQYDQTQYLAAMKKFQRESKGMLPNSTEWNRVRNAIYAELREQKAGAKRKNLESRGQTL